MLNIINDLQLFKNDIKNKKIYMYGHGKRFGYLIDYYDLKNSVKGVIDKNPNIDKQVKYNGYVYPEYTIEEFLTSISVEEKHNICILITPRFQALEIVNELDSYEQLNDVICYVGIILEDMYVPQVFSFTEGEQKIPKIIHYCWFGKTALPRHLQRYIDGWKSKCPEYKIIKWSEENYDIEKNLYMKQAYEKKRWGFVPDYARLDIIFNEGGIYLDTDVEVLRSFDQLLNDDAFFGFNNNMLVSLGLGFGAKKGNEFVKELRDVYSDKTFINKDGSENLTACTFYQHPIFKKHGFVIDNTYQKINGVVVYPQVILSPTGGSNIFDYRNEQSISLHHAELSWKSDDIRRAQRNIEKEFIKRVNMVSL